MSSEWKWMWEWPEPVCGVAEPDAEALRCFLGWSSSPPWSEGGGSVSTGDPGGVAAWWWLANRASASATRGSARK